MTSFPLFCKGRNKSDAQSHLELNTEFLSRFITLGHLYSFETDVVISRLCQIRPFELSYNWSTNGPSLELFDVLEEWFCFAGRGFFEVSAGNVFDAEKCAYFRQAFTDFFAALKLVAQFSISDIRYQNVVIILREQLRRLLLLIEPVHCLDGSVLRKAVMEATTTAVCDVDVFHFTLSIWLESMQVAYILCENDLDAELCCDASQNNLLPLMSSFFPQCCFVMLWDLVSLSAFIFVDRRVTTATATQADALFCICNKHAWFQLMVVCEAGARKKVCAPFWRQLEAVVKSLNQTSPTCLHLRTDIFYVPDESCSAIADRLLFAWWLTSHVSAWFNELPLEQRSDAQSDSTPWNTLDFLLGKTCADSETAKTAISEGRLRVFLRFLLGVTSRWEPESKPLVTLWNFFSQRLRDDFFSAGVRTTGVDEGGCRDWLCHVDACVRPEAEDMLSLNSFQLFLAFLGRSLRQSVSRDKRVWQQMRGHVMRRCTSTFLLELDSRGLDNGLTVLLILLRTSADAEFEGASRQITDILRAVNFPETDRRRLLIWKAIFVVTLMHQQRRQTLSSQVSELARSFEAVFSAFRRNGADLVVVRDLWNMLLKYVAMVGEVFHAMDGDRIDRGECKLLTHHWQTLLVESKNGRDRVIVLGTVQRVLEWSRGGGQNSCVDWLWNSVYPAVIAIASGAAATEHLSMLESCIVGFTDLAVRDSTESSRLCRLWNDFSNGTSINWRLVARFIATVLSSGHETLQKLNSGSGDVPRTELKAVAVWFRLLLTCPQMAGDIDPNMKQLTEFIFDLVSQLFETTAVFRGLTFLSAYDAFLKLVQSLPVCNLAKNDIKKAMEYFKFCFAGGVEHLQVLAKPEVLSSCEFSLRRSFEMIGQLLKHCAALSYSQGCTTCILSTVMAGLVFGPTIRSGELLHPSYADAICGVVPLLVEGVSSLSWQYDVYLQRQIQQIFSLLLIKVSACSKGDTRSMLSLGQATTFRPFVDALAPSCQLSPEAAALGVRKLAVQAALSVINMTMRNEGKEKPAAYRTVLAFIANLVSSTKSVEVLWCEKTVLIAFLLQGLYTGAGVQDWPFAELSDLLEVLLLRFESRVTNWQDLQIHEWLLLKLNEQRQLGSREKWTAFLKQLAVLRATHRRLIANAFDFALETYEKQRGSGRDVEIRFARDNVGTILNR